MHFFLYRILKFTANAIVGTSAAVLSWALVVGRDYQLSTDAVNIAGSALIIGILFGAYIRNVGLTYHIDPVADPDNIAARHEYLSWAILYCTLSLVSILSFIVTAEYIFRIGVLLTIAGYTLVLLEAFRSNTMHFISCIVFGPLGAGFYLYATRNHYRTAIARTTLTLGIATTILAIVLIAISVVENRAVESAVHSVSQEQKVI